MYACMKCSHTAVHLSISYAAPFSSEYLSRVSVIKSVSGNLVFVFAALGTHIHCC